MTAKITIFSLKNINLKVKKGETVGIIGGTGAGKSTLVQHLNGLMKATSGSIYFNGEDIDSDDFNKKMLRKQ